MFITIVLQCVSTVVLSLLIGLVVDWPSAKSLALGGAAAVIPNGLFAMRLAVQRGRAPESFPVVFFLGEMLKIGLTIALLAAIMKYTTGLRWMWLIIGLIVALQVPLFAGFFLRSRAAQAPGKMVQ